jgi:hypothetical protein
MIRSLQRRSVHRAKEFGSVVDVAARSGASSSSHARGASSLTSSTTPSWRGRTAPPPRFRAGTNDVAARCRAMAHCHRTEFIASYIINPCFRRAIRSSSHNLLKDDVYVTMERVSTADDVNDKTQDAATDASCSRGTSNNAVADDEEDEQEEMFVTSDPRLGLGIIREWGGPRRGGALAEPTRFGDWERKGRCTDF